MVLTLLPGTGRWKSFHMTAERPVEGILVPWDPESGDPIKFHLMVVASAVMVITGVFSFTLDSVVIRDLSEGPQCLLECTHLTPFSCFYSYI